LIFPSPTGKHWRTSNYGRQVLKPAYRITLDMYAGTTAGVLDRARTATR
jgi:hypothetical protein